MTPHEEFWAWVAGFVAALGGRTPTEAEWRTVKRKLDDTLHKDELMQTKFVALTPSHMKAKYVEPYSTDADKIAQDFP